MPLENSIKRRTSVRAFLDRPVNRVTVETILEEARWSPSGNNLQPWKVIAVSGAARSAVCQLAKADLNQGDVNNCPGDAYPIRPEPLPEPYASRRIDLGADMFALLGVARADKAARHAWSLDNLDFFGAPVGIFFVIDRIMGHGQWASLGMFMQSVALAATAADLGTCFQEAWAPHRQNLHAHFKLDSNEILYCGMALGWPNASAPINLFRPDRSPTSKFARFYGFPPWNDVETDCGDGSDHA